MEFSNLFSNFTPLLSDGVEHRCKCPSCDGIDLEIKEEKDLGTLLYCPNCNPESILAAVNLPKSERFIDGIETEEKGKAYIEALFRWIDYDYNTTKWEPPGDLEPFHYRDDNGKLKGITDYNIFSFLKEQNLFFVFKGFPYVYTNGYWKRDTSGTVLKTRIRALIYPNVIKSNIIDRIYKLFFQDEEIVVDSINNQPKEWIPFKNGFYDPTRGKLIPYSESTKEYRCTMRSPHTFRKIRPEEGQTIERFLAEILPDPDEREMFLQYAGYCLTCDTDFHKALFIVGKAGIGKSLLVELIAGAVGSEDYNNTRLADLPKRFGLSGLLNKRLNYAGDVPASYNMNDSSAFKSIAGEPELNFELKGVDTFKDKHYVKLIACFNERPKVIGEDSKAVYRRMEILHLDYTPAKIDHKLKDKLKEEIGYFIQISVAALERAYKNGFLFESDSSKAEVNETRRKNDSVEAFLQDETKKVYNKRIDRTILYRAYTIFCEKEEVIPTSQQGFYKALDTKGYGAGKSGDIRYIIGLELIDKDFQTIQDNTEIPFNN